MPKKEINLLPKEEFEKKPAGKVLIWALTVGKWIVILVELIVIAAFFSRFKLDRDLADLHESIRQKQAIIASSSTFESNFNFLQKWLTSIDKLEKGQKGVVNNISNFSALLPIDVILTSLSIREGSINLTGLALSEIGLGSFVKGLSTSSHFGNVNIARVNKSVENGGGINFSLTADIK